MRKLLIAMVVALAGCNGPGPATPAPTVTPTAVGTGAATSSGSPGQIVIHSGDPSLVNYQGGSYRFTWKLAPCTQPFELYVAPTTQGVPNTVLVPAGSAPADGSLTVTLPAGAAYLNSSGCDYTVTIERA